MYNKYSLIKGYISKTRILSNKLSSLKKKLLIQGNTENNLISYNSQLPQITPQGDNNFIIFKKIQYFQTSWLKPIFYKKNANLPLNQALNSYIYIGCDRKLKILFHRLFWNTKITNHRFIALWLRRVIKLVYVNKIKFNITSISLLIKGKLSVTGNKRTRTFKVNYGPNSSTKINSKVRHTYFTVRTVTGVLGLTLSITYNR